jgi:hypothetical protein
LPRLHHQNKKRALITIRTIPITLITIPALVLINRPLCGFASGGRVNIKEDEEEEEEIRAIIAVEL